jgi:hypothetical protein
MVFQQLGTLISKEVLKRDWNDGFVVSGVLSEMMAYGQKLMLLK